MVVVVDGSFYIPCITLTSVFDLSEAASRREVTSFFSQEKFKSVCVQQLQLKISNIKDREPAMITGIRKLTHCLQNPLNQY